LGDSIDGAELWRNVALFAIDLDDEERLLHVSDFQRVGLQEVLSDGHLLAIMGFEALGDWGKFKVDVLN
jgi:hypothetical protein